MHLGELFAPVQSSNIESDEVRTGLKTIVWDIIGDLSRAEAI
jgi:hypothetical protein